MHLRAEVAIEAALAILQRVGARESVLAQKAEQIDLAPQLVLAFDLVDPGQELSLGGLEQVIGVDRALANSERADHTAKTVVLGQLLQELLIQLGVYSHR